MRVTFDFTNIESSQAVQDRLEKKVEKLQRLVAYPLDIQVRTGIDGSEQWVELTCNAEHRLLVAEGRTHDLYEAIDVAVTKMETQLKKEREKRKGHENAHRDAESMGQDVGLSVPHAGKKAQG